jgi:mono/diheme cytochrome c family protein
MKRRVAFWIVLLLALILIVVIVVGLLRPPRLAAQPAAAVAPAAMLTQPIAAGLPNAGQLRRGQHLVALGDCLSCHLAPGGKAFAGGLGLNTPFGVIYSSNISPDPDTGIGRWTPDRFYRALHDGVGDHGNLYPAFPYPWFTRVSRPDSDAILAYLKTVPPVRYTPPANRLAFPLGFRPLVTGWNMLFFRKTGFQPDPRQSAEWNQGAQIVNGLGHCTACHSPKNALGAEKTGEAFHGGVLEDFVAPDLTGNSRTGLGGWSVDDIAEYLKTGRNLHASAGGAMADVITYSSSLMTDGERHAIAVYLKSLPASPTPPMAQADPGAMKRGAAIYSDACSACHLEGGVGQPRFFPPLGRNAVVQQADPTGVLHIILAGTRVGPGGGMNSPLAMPSFAWKLTDPEIADLATYLRNSWGNQAPPVSPDRVRKLRHRLGLDTLRLTANSGDHPQP